MSGEALPKASSVTIISAASTASALCPCERRMAANSVADINSPRLEKVSMARGVTSRTSEKPEQRFSKSRIHSARRGRTAACSAAESDLSATSRWRRASSARTPFQCSRSPRLASVAARTSMSVTPPMAETTAKISAASRREARISATHSIRSGLPTDVPPNFITSSGFLSLPALNGFPSPSASRIQFYPLAPGRRTKPPPAR